MLGIPFVRLLGLDRRDLGEPPRVAGLAGEPRPEKRPGALERELDRIQQRRFILQQARANGLGGHKEIAFTLDSNAPPLAADAPGSAALRVGARR